MSVTLRIIDAGPDANEMTLLRCVCAAEEIFNEMQCPPVLAYVAAIERAASRGHDSQYAEVWRRAESAALELLDTLMGDNSPEEPQLILARW